MRGLKKFFVLLLVVMLLVDVCLADEVNKDSQTKKKTKKKSGKKKGFKPKKDGKLITLTDANFDEQTKNGIWMVKFYAPWSGNSKNIAPYWKEFVRVVGDTIHVAELDCIANPQAAEKFKVTEYPAIYLFGEDLERTEYKGENTVKAWLTFVSEAVKAKVKMLNGKDSINQMYEKLRREVKEDEEMSKNSDVIIVSSATIDEEVKKGPLLVNFYATWCDHCKELRPVWEKFATYAKRNGRPYRVAKVNTAKDHDLATKYRVKGFPTIMFFKEGKQPVSYLGDRSLEGLIEYAESKMLPDPFEQFEL